MPVNKYILDLIVNAFRGIRAMSKQHYKVIFQPQGRSSHVLEGTKIIEAASQAGFSINLPCGGTGSCGKCKIKITQSPPSPNESDLSALSTDEIEQGYRLACQCIVNSDMVVEIPQSSQLVGKHKILTHSDADKDREIIPAVYKKLIEMIPPSLKDDRSDLERLSESIGHCKVDLKLLRKLPSILRENNFTGTAVMTGRTLIDFETGDTTAHCYGIAFDIGTTTVVGTLMDLSSGKELGISSRMNPQVSYGDDVLSRIAHCSQNDDAMQQLHESIINCICDIIKILCSEAGINCCHIYEVNIAGNSTMEQIFCGINPKPLGEVPFSPAFSRGLIFDAKELSLPMNPRGRIYIFPIIGGFVGGDTTACVLSSELWNDTRSALMVDIGTNGEIVLAHDGKLWAASTAAGPALEGARISCGMRATTGAIEKIVFNGDVEISVIGDIDPIGICGSALIDIAAELIKSGVISMTGQMLSKEDIGDSVADYLKERILTDENGQQEFLIAGKIGENKITLTQKDVRELQLAVGAIRAGIMIMLKNAGISVTDLDKVLMAGGFGSFIRRGNAQSVGLLPPEIKRESICYVGNASLAGSKWALLNSKAREQAESIAQKTKHVELSLDADFQMEFASAMLFPKI